MTTENTESKLTPLSGSKPNVTFLGTADAFNACGFANSCYWVNDALGNYVIDFGPTALMKCNEYDCDLDELDLILVTHLHGDHIGGLPMLLLHLTFERIRARPFYIAGPPDTREFVERLWRGTYPSTMKKGLAFDLRFIDWDTSQPIEACQRQIQSLEAVHDPDAQPHSLRIRGPGYTLAVSGDTGWQNALGELSDDVDVFICEATNLTTGYWGHLSIEEHRKYRAQLNPKRLILSHLSHSARMSALALADDYNWIVAHDGLRLDLT
jgi:ribonuclease BN (tRNA processing enzyme)